MNKEELIKKLEKLDKEGMEKFAKELVGDIDQQINIDRLTALMRIAKERIENGTDAILPRLIGREPEWALKQLIEKWRKGRTKIVAGTIASSKYKESGKTIIMIFEIAAEIILDKDASLN